MGLVCSPGLRRTRCQTIVTTARLLEHAPLFVGASPGSTAGEIVERRAFQSADWVSWLALAYWVRHLLCASLFKLSLISLWPVNCTPERLSFILLRFSLIFFSRQRCRSCSRGSIGFRRGRFVRRRRCSHSQRLNYRQRYTRHLTVLKEFLACVARTVPVPVTNHTTNLPTRISNVVTLLHCSSRCQHCNPFTSENFGGTDSDSDLLAS